MKNFEKYAEDIKKTGYDFAVNKRTKNVVKCSLLPCEECIFYSSSFCKRQKIIKWLYEEYTPKTILTIKKVEELLKDKYPEGIEIIDEGV